MQRWFNIVSMLDTKVVSVLCNVENPTSDFLYFQHWINFISLAIHNLETTLIQHQAGITCMHNSLPSCCEQSWNMVKHVCINVKHSIIWWLIIWKPCHRHDITMEYCSIVRLNETSCRSWYHLITWYHGPTWHHLYICKHG